MDAKDATKVLAALKAAYPSSYNNLTVKEATGVINTWFMQFQDVPLEIVMIALQKLISTNKFPPAISEVKEKIQAIHWEAYQVLSDHARYNSKISPEQLKRIQWVYEVTDNYQAANRAEPCLVTLFAGTNNLLLE